MTKSEKNHDTGLRIIEVLKILLEEDIDKQSIIDKLKDNETIGNAFTHEAYIKYFNTFNELGLNIEKINEKVHLKNALIRLDLTENEEKILIKLLQSIPKLNNKKQENIIKNLITKIDKYVKPDLSKELFCYENEPCTNSMIANIINTLKKIMSEEQEATITFIRNNGEEETFSNVAIKKIVEENGHYYILCYKPNMQRSRRIYVNTIKSIKQSPKKSDNKEGRNTVVYELYGRLAKSYKIKQWETMVDFGNGYTRISNTKEDFETLLPRLLKYGENCKIISPHNIIDDFLNLTNDVLKNLEETPCQE